MIIDICLAMDQLAEAAGPLADNKQALRILKSMQQEWKSAIHICLPNLGANEVEDTSDALWLVKLPPYDSDPLALLGSYLLWELFDLECCIESIGDNNQPFNISLGRLREKMAVLAGLLHSKAKQHKSNSKGGKTSTREWKELKDLIKVIISQNGIIKTEDVLKHIKLNNLLGDGFYGNRNEGLHQDEHVITYKTFQNYVSGCKKESQ